MRNKIREEQHELLGKKPLLLGWLCVAKGMAMVFSPILTGSGLAGYAYLQQTREVQQERLAQTRVVQQDVTRFRENIDAIETSDDLMNDRMMLKVALGAFGLDDDLNNKAFIKRILDSDLNDRTSLANRLADKRYLGLAKAFNFQGQGGPILDGMTPPQKISDELAALQSPDDLFKRGDLLMAALDTFGLRGDAGNRYFLEQVFMSNPADPNSFANSLTNPAYAEMAQAFGFADKVVASDSVYGFAQAFEGAFPTLEDADALLQNQSLLTSALSLFGLEGDVNQTDFLRNVLESDLLDDSSFANQLSDERYAAFAEAFGFGLDPLPADPDTGIVPRRISKAEDFVETVLGQSERVETVEDYFLNFRFMLDTADMFNVRLGADGTTFLKMMLEDDRTDRGALINTISDKRYRALADALQLQEPPEEKLFPPGFAEEVTSRYLTRQFEIAVGENDNSLRVAIAMDRELDDVVSASRSNDSHWYSIMASSPLRSLFETTFNLPSSFGALDLDRQLIDLKDRAESMFGTSVVKDIITADNKETLRQQYLLKSSLSGSTGVLPTSTAVTLLSGASSGGLFG